MKLIPQWLRDLLNRPSSGGFTHECAFDWQGNCPCGDIYPFGYSPDGLLPRNVMSYAGFPYIPAKTKENTVNDNIKMPPRKHNWNIMGGIHTASQMDMVARQRAEVEGYNRALDDVEKLNKPDPYEEMYHTYGVASISVTPEYRNRREPYSGYERIVHQEVIRNAVRVESSLGTFTLTLRGDQDIVASATKVLAALKEVSDESPF